MKIMTDIETAIEITQRQIEELKSNLPTLVTQEYYDSFNLAIEVKQKAIQALQEKAERDKGCEYCDGKRNEYQHTIDTKLSIITFEKARVLETECNRCPPYANCCMKNIPSRSFFLINFCPHCGRKLTSAPTDER